MAQMSDLNKFPGVTEEPSAWGDLFLLWEYSVRDLSRSIWARSSSSSCFIKKAQVSALLMAILLPVLKIWFRKQILGLLTYQKQSMYLQAKFGD